jgi:HTH-type transcriptional regulator / antitoxin HipB
MDQASRTPQQLGAALRRYRKAHSLTQGDLGAKINKRQATISALEAGEGGTLETLLAVFAALDLELVIRPRTKSNVAGLGEIF